jgi:hypothetical protein
MPMPAEWREGCADRGSDAEGEPLAGSFAGRGSHCGKQQFHRSGEDCGENREGQITSTVNTALNTTQINEDVQDENRTNSIARNE